MNARRLILPQSPADYAAIAVAPLLIFLMISSLANFLMLILYTGRFPVRLSWTLLMFTLGAVGIARIAIERDRSYALGYGGILGIFAYVALLRFVDSPVFCFFILVVIAYLADVIVRDCTLIDDDVDASGQGLIDSGRLFVRQKIEDQKKSTTPSDDDAVEPKRRKTHQPGRTVMYLALAALPLFGLGQFMLRNTPDIWTRARWLLAFYLFASLSLLVTTSFLGLRRYLRQRSVEMPGDVSIGWLAGGLSVIALVLSLAYLAPLPGRALATFEPPRWLDSPGGTVASRFGWGDEGADQSDPGDPKAEDARPDGDESQGIKAQDDAPAGEVSQGDREEGPTGQETGGKKNPQQDSSDPQQDPTDPSDQQQDSSDPTDPSDPTDQQQDSSDPTDQQQDSSDPTDPQQDPSDPSDPSDQQQDPTDPSDQSDPTDQQQDPTDPSDQSDPTDQQQDPTDQQQDPSDQQQAPTEQSRDIVGSITGIFKALVYLLLAAIVAIFLWLHRDLIAAWWRYLFGGRELESEAPSDTPEPIATTPPRPFASFRNPIGSESDLRKIVVITFQAFEAWTREQGTPRHKDETPAEFMRRVAKVEPRMSTSAAQVVEAYNRIVYGRGRATQRDVNAAEKVWRVMSS